MSRSELTPREKEYKRIVANRLSNLLSDKGAKQVDISNQTGIPTSTLTGYFKGTSLPSPGNVQKLADFFGVLKSDIDPRFESSKDDSASTDLDKILDHAMSYDGKPMNKHDREVIRAYIEGYMNNQK